MHGLHVRLPRPRRPPRSVGFSSCAVATLALPAHYCGLDSLPRRDTHAITNPSILTYPGTAGLRPPQQAQALLLRYLPPITDKLEVGALWRADLASWVAHTDMRLYSRMQVSARTCIYPALQQQTNTHTQQTERQHEGRTYMAQAARDMLRSCAESGGVDSTTGRYREPIVKLSRWVGWFFV